MKNDKLNTNKLRISKLLYLVVFFLMSSMIFFVFYRSLVNYNVGDKSITEFIMNRNIHEEVIMPTRGTIYDRKGNILAQDVSSYTLIAYLSESRSTDGVIRHVVDKEKTAKALSKKIDMSYDKILAILNKDAYQVEFGTAGKNLSQLEMEAINDLNLPGIGFSKSVKRYYPYGDFSSYLLGYTKNKEDEDGNIWMNGELGIEGYYDEELKGTSGYVKYEQDAKGNKIVNSNEYTVDAEDGASVNLTIDSNIQLFIENAVAKAQKNSKAEWVLMAIMDAKTGAILGYSSTPSFDPNIRNIKNYMDPIVSYQYEPGSTMKTFSYMCAIESGKYNGTDTFMSGSKTYVSVSNKKDKVTIKDWNGKGWGRITYDYGFAQSSNIGVASLVAEVISKKELSACYQKYGFGKTTGISLNGELKGNIAFNYDVEVATAGYGQGITVTPVQMLQAFSSISNNGIMLKPYVVNSVVSSTGEVLESYGRTELGRVASEETITKIKSLLKSVVCNNASKCTGSAYYIKGYDLIGKTGTASIYDYDKGAYSTGSDNIYSFAGLYPGDDPNIIVYMAIKKPKDGNNYIAPAIKSVIVDASKYLSLDDNKDAITSFKIDNYLNKNVVDVKTILSDNQINTILLGTGAKVIGQYPSKDIDIYEGDRVYLLTNNYKNMAIDFNGLSYKEAVSILKLMGVKYEISGSGYVYSQSIKNGEEIKDKIVLKLKDKYIT